MPHTLSQHIGLKTYCVRLAASIFCCSKPCERAKQKISSATHRNYFSPPRPDAPDILLGIFGHRNTAQQPFSVSACLSLASRRYSICEVGVCCAAVHSVESRRIAPLLLAAVLLLLCGCGFFSFFCCMWWSAGSRVRSIARCIPYSRQHPTIMAF